MARTYAAVEIDDDAAPQGWKLMRSFSSSVELIRKLRPKGFFANHVTLHELEQDCIRLSKSLDESLHPSSDTKNLFNEQAVQSPLARRLTDATIGSGRPDQDDVKALWRHCAPLVDLPKNSSVYDWHVLVENGETVPITEVPYAESSLCSVSTHATFILSGVLGKEQEQLCVSIQEWKLGLTADCSLAIYAKTPTQVWVQLGKPEELYEQTIRSVQVYIQLFSMVVTDLELTGPMLFQHLTTKFNYWKVKPDVSDLDESLILMRKFNLGCLFPLERRVLSRVMAEAGDVGDDNGGKPLTFKRARSRRHANAIEEATMKTTSGNDEEILASKRQTRSSTGTAATTDMDQCEILSPSRSESDHILLSSKLHDLKKRKANPEIKEDVLAADRTLQRKINSTKTGVVNVVEVVPGNTERASASLKSPVDDRGQLELDFSESRIEGIMRETARSHQWGSEYKYLSEPFPIIRKLWDSTSMVRHALNCLEKGGTMEDAQSFCSVESLRNISGNEVALRDYGVSQFFPAVNKQREVAERINYYAHDGDTVVEICSQAVDYLSLLKERVTNMGKLCNYKRFMVDQSQRQDVKDWMNKEGLPTGSKLLICLSLSFALWGEQSNKILDYALELKPKLIVLIAPLFSRRLDEQSTYNLIWADTELLQSEILWPWGLFEVPSNDLDKRKGVSPGIYLWSRTDWATKHRQIASRFGHLQKSVPNLSKGQG